MGWKVRTPGGCVRATPRLHPTQTRDQRLATSRHDELRGLNQPETSLEPVLKKQLQRTMEKTRRAPLPASPAQMPIGRHSSRMLR